MWEYPRFDVKSWEFLVVFFDPFPLFVQENCRGVSYFLVHFSRNIGLLGFERVRNEVHGVVVFCT